MIQTRRSAFRFSVLAIALFGCDKPLSQEAGDELGSSEESGTEESGAQTETTQTSTETSSNFVPDMADTGDTACDPFMQDCPAGEKCVPYASSGGTWDANKCVQVTGDAQPGDSCIWDGPSAGTDNCGEDSICWDAMDVDGVAVGVCTPFCDGSADNPICDPQTSCLIANEGAITLCITTCDPLLQDCAEGLGCYWANSDFNCVFTTDGSGEGQPCGYINDCAPGNLCAAADALPECAGSSCCAAYCDLASPDCLTAGTECVTFFEEGLAPPGYEDVGICVLPG